MVREQEPVLFIFNPISGISNPKNLSSLIEKSLHNSRFRPVIVYAENSSDAYLITKEHIKKGIRKVFAVGGDSAVNDIAKALVNTETILGIIPSGTGNGLARHLNIPMMVSKAVRLISRQNIAMIDYGYVNQNPFFCNAGVGFDAYIGSKFNQQSGRGIIQYVKTAITDYPKYKPEYYKLQDTGYSIEKEAFLISIANASQYGNQVFIAPDADVTDGLLDVTVISPFPKYLSPSVGIKLFTRKLGKSRFVEMFRIRELAIERQQAGLVNIDGEQVFMGKNLIFKVKHLGLKVYIP